MKFCCWAASKDCFDDQLICLLFLFWLIDKLDLKSTINFNLFIEKQNILKKKAQTTGAAWTSLGF